MQKGARFVYNDKYAKMQCTFQTHSPKCECNGDLAEATSQPLLVILVAS